MVGDMHNLRLSMKQLSEEAGCTLAYVSMILSGKRTPKGGRERLEAALEQLKERERVRNAESELLSDES